MASVNQMNVVGNVGTINELKGTADMPVLSFSVATSDYVGKGKGDPGRNGEATDYGTTWHDITVFGKRAASLATKLGKGDVVHATGPLRKEKFTRKDGTAGESSRIMADNVTVITSKGGATGGTSAPVSAPVDDSDIPF